MTTKLQLANSTASKSLSSTPPVNAIDGNPATRWSTTGMGNYLTVSSDDIYKIAFLNIAFYSGHTRKTTFDVLVSEDGVTFQPVTTFTSGGTTSAAQKFNLPTPVKAKHIRILFKKVTYNTGSNSTSCAIIDIEAWGEPQPVLPTKYGWDFETSLNGTAYSKVGIGIGLNARVLRGPVILPVLSKIEAAIVGKTPEPDGTYKGTDREEFTFSGMVVNDDNSILPGKTLKLVADGSVVGSGVTDADGMVLIKKIFPEGTYNVVQLSE